MRVPALRDASTSSQSASRGSIGPAASGRVDPLTEYTVISLGRASTPLSANWKLANPGRAVVRIERRLALPLADQDEVVGLGDRLGERVPQAARLAGGVALRI